MRWCVQWSYKAPRQWHTGLQAFDAMTIAKMNRDRITPVLHSSPNLFDTHILILYTQTDKSLKQANTCFANAPNVKRTLTNKNNVCMCVYMGSQKNSYISQNGSVIEVITMRNFPVFFFLVFYQSCFSNQSIKYLHVYHWTWLFFFRNRLVLQSDSIYTFCFL